MVRRLLTVEVDVLLPERERERERETYRQTDRQRDTDRQTDREARLVRLLNVDVHVWLRERGFLVRLLAVEFDVLLRETEDG